MWSESAIWAQWSIIPAVGWLLTATAHLRAIRLSPKHPPLSFIEIWSRCLDPYGGASGLVLNVLLTSAGLAKSSDISISDLFRSGLWWLVAGFGGLWLVLTASYVLNLLPKRLLLTPSSSPMSILGQQLLLTILVIAGSMTGALWHIYVKSQLINIPR